MRASLQDKPVEVVEQELGAARDTRAAAKADRARESYRRDVIPADYQGWRHFASIGALYGGIATALLLLTGPIQSLEWLAIPGSLAVCNLVEWVAHRYIMHRPTRISPRIYRRHTQQHHQFFNHARRHCRDHRDFHIILSPPKNQALFLIVFTAPTAALLAIAGASLNIIALGLATACAYFLAYEWLHLAFHLEPHHPLARIPGVQALGRHHQDHHDTALMAKWNFNISFAWTDRVLGTKFAAARNEGGGRRRPSP
jgi:hypothetical protein